MDWIEFIAQVKATFANQNVVNYNLIIELKGSEWESFKTFAVGQLNANIDDETTFMGVIIRQSK